MNTRTLLKRWSYTFGIILLLICIGACMPSVRFPVISRAPEKFFQNFRGMQTIGLYVVDNGLVKEEWKSLAVGSIENELHAAGYFNIVDVSHRQDLLKELAFQASGITRDAMQIGSWDETEGLLFLEFFQKPVFCKKDPDSFFGYRSYVFLKASLVDVRSSRKISITLNDPVRTGACGDQAAVLAYALKQLSAQVATALSPLMSYREVPLDDDVSDLTGKDRERIRLLLRSGMEWVRSEPSNFDYAKRDWEQAYEESGRASASATWNLAICYWHDRDYGKAEDFFRRAFSGARENRERKEIYGHFREEMQWLGARTAD